jgi:hypothetical protein
LVGKSPKTKERKILSTKSWMVIETQSIKYSNSAHTLMGIFGMLREILLFLFVPHCNTPNPSGRKNGGKKQ